MSLKLLFDVHVPRAVRDALRPEIDILTAQEDDSDEALDPILLDRATAGERVLVTHDKDLLREAARRQRHGVTFSGVIFAHQSGISLSVYISDLRLIAQVESQEDFLNRVEYLPLK